MKRVVVIQSQLWAAAIGAALWFWTPAPAAAQTGASSIRGENFSDKPAPQLFASDCTGSNCHQGPQGLAKGKSQGTLAAFLREHYTNSRESAAALAKFLASVPAEAQASRPHPSARSSRAAARTGEETHPVPPGRVPRAAESQETPPKPGARPVRGRPTRVAAPEAPPPTPPPQPKQFNIFD